jgi:hypothetical protein
MSETRLPRLLDGCRGLSEFFWLLKKISGLAVTGGVVGRGRRHEGGWHASVAMYWDPPAFGPGRRDALDLSDLNHLQDALGCEPQHPRGLLHGVVTDLSTHAVRVP